MDIEQIINAAVILPGVLEFVFGERLLLGLGNFFRGAFGPSTVMLCDFPEKWNEPLISIVGMMLMTGLGMVLMFSPCFVVFAVGAAIHEKYSSIKFSKKIYRVAALAVFWSLAAVLGFAFLLNWGIVMSVYNFSVSCSEASSLFYLSR